MARNQTAKRIGEKLLRYRQDMESVDRQFERLSSERSNLAGKIEALEEVLQGEATEPSERMPSERRMKSGPLEADPAMPSERDGDPVRRDPDASHNGAPEG